jgi:hypothetical protein
MAPRFDKKRWHEKTSLEDIRQGESVQAARKHAVDCIKRILAVTPDKKIRDITPIELDHICIAAITGWVLKRNEIETGEPNDPIIDLFL